MPYNAMKNRAFVPEEKFMREALSLAEEAFSAGEVPVGAVVVKDGKVIGRGRNRREEHQSVLGHAELEAMEQAAKVLGSWRLTGCTLYVTLEPCPMCAGATVNARVDRIVFGTEDEAMGACGTVFVRGHMPYNAMKNRAFVPEEKFMREALSLAEEAFSAGEVPVGAVVVKDGKVIGRGRNRREEHQSVLGHAELEAMEQAAKVLGSWRLTGCTLYVTLEPCPMCAGATVNARVDRIVFGTEDEAMGACGTAVSVTSLKNAFKPELYRGLLCEECTAILRRFFKARRAERTEK